MPGLEGDGGDEHARATVITVTARHAYRQATGLADTDATKRARGLPLTYDSIRIKPFTPEPHGGQPRRSDRSPYCPRGQPCRRSIRVVRSRTTITVRLKGARARRDSPKPPSPRASRRQKDLNLRGGFPRLRALQARPFGRSGMPPWIAIVPRGIDPLGLSEAEAVRFERTRGLPTPNRFRGGPVRPLRHASGTSVTDGLRLSARGRTP